MQIKSDLKQVFSWKEKSILIDFSDNGNFSVLLQQKTYCNFLIVALWNWNLYQ